MGILVNQKTGCILMYIRIAVHCIPCMHSLLDQKNSVSSDQGHFSRCNESEHQYTSILFNLILFSCWMSLLHNQHKVTTEQFLSLLSRFCLNSKNHLCNWHHKFPWNIFEASSSIILLFVTPLVYYIYYTYILPKMLSYSIFCSNC